MIAIPDEARARVAAQCSATCLQRIPVGAESCPQCGGQSFRAEYDPAALVESDRRAAARGTQHDMG